MISVYKDTVHNSYKLNLSDMGLSFLEFNLHSLESDIESEKNEGVDGEYVTKNQYLGRRIDAKLYLKAENSRDFQNKKSNVYKLFNSKTKHLMIDERLDKQKVWEVYTESNYKIENGQTSYTAEIELTFVSESAYAKSLNETETTINQQSGIVFNDSDIYLDAREHDIEIQFSGGSNKLRIVNETTDTQWQYKSTTEALDIILIKSIYPFKNGVNIFGETNYGALEFAKGSNTIKLYGTIGNFNLSIKYHNLYV